MRFVEGVAGDALHELVVGNRVAVAEHHGGDLGVEDRARDRLGHVPDDLDVLTRGVENLDNFLVGHERKKRRQVDVVGQRVDHHRLVRARHLRDAEQRVIGGLAQELGVDGDEGVARHMGADLDEFRGGGDHVHCSRQPNPIRL